MSSKKNSVLFNLPIISSVLYIVATGLILAFSTSASAITQEDKDSLVYLLKQDCGSCHGLTLQGGLGPALLKKNLEGKPKAYLEYIIGKGRPGTPMPPWENILKAEEISFLADYLLSEQNVLANYQMKTATPILVRQSDSETVHSQNKK